MFLFCFVIVIPAHKNKYLSPERYFVSLDALEMPLCHLKENSIRCAITFVILCVMLSGTDGPILCIRECHYSFIHPTPSSGSS